MSASSTRPAEQTTPAARRSGRPVVPELRPPGPPSARPSVAADQNNSSHKPSCDDVPAARDRSTLRAIVQGLPAALGIVVMLTYFVWVCLQMSAHAPGGDALALAIFGAAAAGVLAALAGLLRR